MILQNNKGSLIIQYSTITCPKKSILIILMRTVWKVFGKYLRVFNIFHISTFTYLEHANFSKSNYKGEKVKEINRIIAMRKVMLTNHNFMSSH